MIIGRRWASRVGLAVLTLTTLVAVAAPGRAAARATALRAIPEGAAVWFACTQPSFSQPFSLRCPVPYDPRYAQTFLQGFDRLTPENEFKMEFLEPQETHFNFAVADQVAEFAQASGKTIRGHTLVWDDQNPGWLTHPLLPWSAAALGRVMDSYISTVVSHFARAFPGVVTEWDVVNEPLASNGTLEQNLWRRVLGPGYIERALDDAHAADPSARLLINDEGTEIPGPKAEGMLALATELKQAGAPLSAVGFEAHVTPATAPSLSDLLTLWHRYAEVGLDVEVTELDVDNDLSLGGPVDDPAAKAAVFERYARACRLAGNCVGYTVWGVADRYSWLGSDRDDLLYDTNFQPKPEAPVVRRLLTGAGARPRITQRAGAERCHLGLRHRVCRRGRRRGRRGAPA
jgi:endo-1,4-beta-xylanase